jgi:sortase A
LRTLIVLLAASAAGVLIYPTAAQWFSDANQAVELSGFVHHMAQLPDAEKQAMLDAAYEYNRLLPPGPITDPYTTTTPVQATNFAAYMATLNMGSQGLMGTLAIGSINAYLPIYHGTTPSVLDVGVGHLYSTTLPVGGDSTHAILTAHSGMINKTLFNNLHKVKLGDKFTIRILDEIFTYQIDQILTVDPTHTDALRPIPGEDHVTLVTCTPIGINTHRLLVRGTRIPTPEPVDPDAQLAGYTGPGFPWWAFAIPLAILTATLATRPRVKTPQRTNR